MDKNEQDLLVGGCMNKTAFEMLASKTRLKERAMRLAFRAMVSGENPADIAKDEFVSRQLVEQAVRRIARQQDIEAQIPETWIQISISLPPDLADSVLWIHEQAKLEAGVIIKGVRKTPEITGKRIELLTDLIAGKLKKE